MNTTPPHNETQAPGRSRHWVIAGIGLGIFAAAILFVAIGGR